MMPNVTFLINGVSYTLSPTAYILPVRAVSLFCESQYPRHAPATSPFKVIYMEMATTPPSPLPASPEDANVAFSLTEMKLPVVETPGLLVSSSATKQYLL